MIKRPPAAKKSKPANLQDLVPGLRLMPGEDYEMMERLRTSLMAELGPCTPYEHVLAANLVTLELECVRLRSMRDDLLMNAMIDVTQRLISSEMLRERVDELAGETAALWDIEREFDARRAKLYRDRSGKRLLAYLHDNGLDAAAIRAEAYAFAGEQLYPFEAQLAAAEQRRRRLLSDYADLRAKNLASPGDDVLDAELIDVL